MAIGAEVRILERVFCVDVVTQDRACSAKERRVVPAHELLERAAVARQDARH